MICCCIVILLFFWLRIVALLWASRMYCEVSHRIFVLVLYCTLADNVHLIGDQTRILIAWPTFIKCDIYRQLFSCGGYISPGSAQYSFRCNYPNRLGHIRNRISSTLIAWDFKIKILKKRYHLVGSFFYFIYQQRMSRKNFVIWFICFVFSSSTFSQLTVQYKHKHTINQNLFMIKNVEVTDILIILLYIYYVAPTCCCPHENDAAPHQRSTAHHTIMVRSRTIFVWPTTC